MARAASREISLDEVHGSLQEAFREVQAGETVALTSGGHLIALLVPPPSEASYPPNSGDFVDFVLRFRAKVDLEALDAGDAFDIPRTIDPPREIELG